jgi:hypothetical protein
MAAMGNNTGIVIWVETWHELTWHEGETFLTVGLYIAQCRDIEPLLLPEGMQSF